MTYLIRAAGLSGFEDLVRSLNGNPNLVLQSAGLLSSQLRNPDALINYQSYINALELAAEHCHSETFGLQLSLNQGIGSLGIIGALMSRQKTVKDALIAAQKYIYLHNSGFQLSVDLVTPNVCKYRYHLPIDQPKNYPQKAQLSLGMPHQVMKTLIGPAWMPKKVQFQQSPTEENKLFFKKVFACDIEFKADSDAIFFNSDILDLKPRVEEGLIDNIISKLLEDSVSSSHEQLALDLIEQTIRTLLPTGECNVKNTAMCMNIHPKKLQRILLKENTSYRDVLENVRKKEAISALTAGEHSLTHVALNLGYSEFSVFSRRFKEWFGVSPSMWNKDREQR